MNVTKRYTGMNSKMKEKQEELKKLESEFLKIQSLHHTAIANKEKELLRIKKEELIDKINKLRVK